MLCNLGNEMEPFVTFFEESIEYVRAAWKMLCIFHTSNVYKRKTACVRVDALVNQESEIYLKPHIYVSPSRCPQKQLNSFLYNFLPSHLSHLFW